MQSTVLQLGTDELVNGKIRGCTEWHKKTGTFEKPNKNWRNKKKLLQKLNHYNLPF